MVVELEKLFHQSGSTSEVKEPMSSTVDSEPVHQEAAASIENETAQEGELEAKLIEDANASKQEDISVKEDNPAEDILTDVDLNIVDGIIKAPKVEVAGIKVVGKIELPEKKNEVIEDENTEVNAEQSEPSSNEETDNLVTVPNEPKEVLKNANKRTSDRKRSERKSRTKRVEKQLLTPEEERRIQLKEAQKKKIAEQQAKKEQRRKTYNEDMKSVQKTVSSGKKKKTASSKPQKKSKPTSLWGIFLHWLND
ncbi:MAG: hypothetical protein P8O07_05135 [Crocinitomicaceae bacterium]|nr:hypothetical protein [Crocinitomicaceae bacterium]